MKRIIRDSLIYLAIIVLILCVVHGVDSKQWLEFKFYGSIFVAALVFRMLKSLTDRFQSKYFIFEILLEFIVALTVFLTFGWFLKWYEIEGIGTMCLIVVCVYIISYFLNLATTKREISEINEQINHRKQENIK